MTTLPVCHWHPDRETGLRCGSCGRSICVECMRQHPVGIRCRECSNPTRLPTHEVSTSYVARGVAAAIGMGLAGGVALIIVLRVVPGAGFFFFFLMLGLGYAIGQGVGAAVNRRRGRAYQYMALGATLLATAPVSVTSLASLSFGGLIDLAGVAVAAVVAWHRLAP